MDDFWGAEDTSTLPASPPDGKKKARKARPGAPVESFLDREERKATKKWNKLQVKKEAHRAMRQRKGETRAKVRGPNLKRLPYNDDDTATPRPAGAALSPWEQASAGLGAGIRRRNFKVSEVQGFEFVGGFDYKQLPALGLAEIAFLGRSNVGKSSMLNRLAGPGQKPALVSKMPGRTQRINMFRVADRRGPVCAFADLPGYGFAKISKEGQASIETFLARYLEKRTELQLVILLVDSRREPMGSDLEVYEYFAMLGVPCLVVATKVDKLADREREASTRVLADAFGLTDSTEEVLGFSSSTGEGVAEVWEAIRSVVIEDVRGPPQDAGVEGSPGAGAGDGAGVASAVTSLADLGGAWSHLAGDVEDAEGAGERGSSPNPGRSGLSDRDLLREFDETDFEDEDTGARAFAGLRETHDEYGNITVAAPWLR